MPAFAYKAVTETGDIVEGRIEAASKAEVFECLRARGQMAIRAEPAAAGSAGRRPPRRRSAVPPRELAMLTRELATLVGAGLPLDRALAFAAELSPRPARRALLQRLLGRIKAGTSLSDALADEARFPPLYVAAVRAGEAGGALGGVLERLADHLERGEALRQALRSAMIYPVILMGMAALTVLILATVLLPQFEGLFADAGERVPWQARLVMDAAAALRAHWWAGPAALALSGLAAAQAWRRPALRLRVDAWLLRLPLLGPLLRKADAARLTRTLGTLLANGVGHLHALDIAREVIGNHALRRGVDALAAGLKEGEGLAAPLLKLDLLPPVAVQLVHLGEETGRLEEMLGRAADMLDADVQRTLARLLGLLAPVMTIALGIVIAAIIGAVLSAILSIYQLPI